MSNTPGPKVHLCPRCRQPAGETYVTAGTERFHLPCLSPDPEAVGDADKGWGRIETGGEPVDTAKQGLRHG